MDPDRLKEILLAHKEWLDSGGEKGARAPGRALESKYGPHLAGTMIYRASTGRSPNLFASTEDAMTDIRKCAEEESTNGP